MKILIVDDNAGMRRLLRRAVPDTASAIWECSDGADALAAYAERHPNVVLMDIRMLRMGGLAAARQIFQRIDIRIYPDLMSKIIRYSQTVNSITSEEIPCALLDVCMFFACSCCSFRSAAHRINRRPTPRFHRFPIASRYI